MDYFFIGDPELVTAFRFTGIDGMVVRDAEEAAIAFKRITEGGTQSSAASEPDIAFPDSLLKAQNCRVLIITEEVADWLEKFLVSWQLSGNYPLIVEIPGIAGRLPNRKTLVDSIREAIGVHV